MRLRTSSLDVNDPLAVGWQCQGHCQALGTRSALFLIRGSTVYYFSGGSSVIRS